MDVGGPFSWFFDLFHGGADGSSGSFALVLIGGTLLILLLVAFLVLRRLLGKKQTTGGSERLLREDLAEYPPAPAAGPRRLAVEGQPARMRLVVVAALGQQAGVSASEVERFLDQVLPGLGDVARQDKPRVKVWPPQLSHRGFAPTFHRVVTRPERDGADSRWVLVAGQAKVGKFPVLLGLALQADDANSLGRLTVEPHQWAEVLRVS